MNSSIREKTDCHFRIITCCFDKIFKRKRPKNVRVKGSSCLNTKS